MPSIYNNGNLPNIGPTNTTGIYGGSYGALPSNVAVLLEYLSSNGNVEFSLDVLSGNTQIKGTIYETLYGDGNVAVFLEDFVSNISTTGNVEASYFLGDGSLLSNVVQDTAEIEAFLASGNSTTITAVESNVSTLQSNSSSQQAAIDAVESNVSTLQSNASAQQSAIDAAESDISNVAADLTTLEFYASVFPAQIAANGSNIALLQTNAINQQNDLALIVSNVATAQGDIVDLESNASTQQAAIDAVESNVATAQGEISGLLSNAVSQQAEIIVLQSNVVSLESNMSAQQALIDILESNVVSLDSNASSQQTAIDAVESNVALLQDNERWSETVHYLAINRETVSLAKGTPVYASDVGAQGNPVDVKAADASDPTKMPVIGILEETLAAGATGYLITSGHITGIDTSGFVVGDTIYVSAGGMYSNVSPHSEGNIIQVLGVLAKAHPSNGGGIINLGSVGRTPNLDNGNIFIGNAVNQSTTMPLDTSIVPENGNVYYTAARAVAGVSAGTLTGLDVNGISTFTNATNTTGVGTGAVQITGGLDVAMDVYVQGTIFANNLQAINQTTLTVDTPLLYLTSSNAYPYNYDIGFYSHFVGGASNIYQHTGLIRDYISDSWIFFSNITDEPSGNVVDTNSVGIRYDDVRVGNVYANAAIIANANITASFFNGDGSALTNLPAIDGYTDGDVASYLPTDSTIIAIQTVNTNQNNTIALLQTNNSTQQAAIDTVESDIVNLQSNASSQQVAIDAVESDVVLLQSNASTQQASINGIINTSIPALESNMSAQQAAIDVVESDVATLQGQVYTDGDVAAYLPTHTGNVAASYFLGDGSLLTGVASAYGDSEVETYLSSGSSTVITGLNSNASSQQFAIDTVEFDVAALQSNASSQQVSIDAVESDVATLQGQVFTTTNARTSVSATDAGGDGAFAYNNTTGVFTYTGPSASEVRSHFTAGTNITITNGVIASTAAGGGGDLVDDLTPQLGGALDVNGKSIVSISNGNINIVPNGSGLTKITNLQYSEKIHDLGTTGGTIAPNAANGNTQKITLNSGLTINGLTSPVAGQSLTLIIYGASAYGFISSTMKFAGGDKTLTGLTGCIDILHIFYDGTNYLASINKGYE